MDRTMPNRSRFLAVLTACMIVPGALQPLQETPDESFPEEFERTNRSNSVRVRVREALVGFNDPATVPGLFAPSPDGHSLAYGIMGGGGITVVANGEKGELYEGIAESSLKFSSKGRHLTYVGTRPSGQFVVLDGKAYAYAGVSEQGVVFNEQGDRTAWVAARDGAQIAVIDGIESPPFSGVAPPGVLFSADGKRTAFAATSGQKSLVVLDGEEGPLFDRVGGLKFSAGGQAIYVGLDEDKSYAVVNTTSYGPFDSIRSPSGQKPQDGETPDLLEFSSNGSRFGFIASRGDDWFLVLDGKEIGPYSGVAGLAISPEGSRVAYLATRGEGWFLVIDGKEHPGLSIKTLSFSSDGKRFGSIVRKGDKFLAWIDGVEGKPYDRIEDPGIRFSPIGNRAAYLAVEGDDSFVVVDGVEGPRFKRLGKIGFGYVPNSSRTLYSIRRRNQEALVVDGVEGPYFQSFRSLAFSHDGSRYAYAGEVSEDEWIVIVDGDRYGPGGKLHTDDTSTFSSVGKRTPLFSPDGRHVAWTGVSDRGCFAVVDGKESLPYNIVMRTTLGFSPDSQHFAFAAERNGTKYIVVDGLELDNGWHGFLQGSDFEWEGARRFYILGTRSPKYLRIEIELL